MLKFIKKGKDMKKLKIIFKDIVEFIRQRKVIFIILIASLVISIYSFFFIISTAMNEVNSYNVSIGAKGRYYISNNAENIELEKIKRFIVYINEKFPTSIYRVYSKPVLAENENQQKMDTYETHNHNITENYNVCIGTNRNNNVMKDYIGRLITKEDVEEKSRYILIGITDKLSMNNSFILNSEIQFCKHNYIVQGLDQINVNSQEYAEKSTLLDKGNTDYDIGFGYIPISTFFEDNFETVGFEIFLPNEINESAKREFEKNLGSSFKEYMIEMPTRTDNVNLADINSQVVIYSLFLLISMVNIIALFKYWIEKNWRKYMIYRICGATKKEIYIIIISESIIITFFSSLCAVILYYIMLNFFKSIGINYVLKINEIIAIIVLVILSVFANTHILAKKISNIEARYIGGK